MRTMMMVKFVNCYFLLKIQVTFLSAVITDHVFVLDDSFEEDDFDEDAYYERLGTRPPLDSSTLGGYQKMVELFCLCTEEDPHKRPSAAHIVHALESNTQLSDRGSEVIVID